jgi:tetratricopeptide (TPR) repeat protein
MTSTSDAERTDRYLLGQMSSQEENQFRLRLEQEPELAHYVDQTALLMQGLRLVDERERIRLKLQMVEGQLLEERQPGAAVTPPIAVVPGGRKHPLRSVLAAAALMALLVVASVWTIGRINTQRHLASDFFQPIPSEMILLMDQLDGAGFALPDEAHRKSLLRALEHYERRDFDAAEMALLRYLQDQPVDLNAQMFLGLTYLAKEQPEKAVDMLLPVAQTHEYALRDCARWYLVLSMVESGDTITSIRKHLSILAANPGGPYYEKATNLLKRTK